MTFLSAPLSALRSAPRRFATAIATLALGTFLLLQPAHAVAPASPDPSGSGSISHVAHPGATRYELRLHHLHTGETLDVVYRIGDEYIPAAMDKLNHFLRDHRTQDTADYDPKEFDLLHNLLGRLHKPNGEIDIVCGYRTPESNSFLRTLGGKVSPTQTGVAEHSQHMLSKAIDIRVPGVRTRSLRDAALSLHAGGVGYYPVSQFVHVDVGPVRQWSFR